MSDTSEDELEPGALIVLKVRSIQLCSHMLRAHILAGQAGCAPSNTIQKSHVEDRAEGLLEHDSCHCHEHDPVLRRCRRVHRVLLLLRSSSRLHTTCLPAIQLESCSLWLRLDRRSSGIISAIRCQGAATHASHAKQQSSWQLHG